jgi:hypothetical protein
MAITVTQKAHLNKMNRAAKDVLLGNIVGNLAAGGNLTSGSYSISSTESNASKVSLDTGLSAVRGWIVQPNRSGSIVYVLNSVSASTAGRIDITAASGSKLATSDVINWIAF